MPTQRFLNLKDSKKNAILEAAANEFARVPYSAVSINQIIKEAEISRGSFYTYFEDKDDLMRYMLRGFRDTLRKKVFEFLEEENGNPFRLCIRLLKDWIKTGSERITFQIHRNLLADLSVTGQNQMFGIRGFLMKDELYKSFVEELYNRLDKDRYPTTIETLCYIVDMAIMILIKSMAMYYQNPSEKETIIQVLTEEMTILERGMCVPRLHSSHKRMRRLSNEKYHKKNHTDFHCTYSIHSVSSPSTYSSGSPEQPG